MRPLNGVDGRQGTTRSAMMAGDQHVTMSAAKPLRERLLDALNREYGLGVSALNDVKLHYIRGVSDFEFNGDPIHTVIFPPEFLYTADIGRGRLAGFNLYYGLPDVDPRIVVLGDPDFPDTGDIGFWSVQSRKPGDLVYPVVPGSIIVGFHKVTTLPDAQAALSGYLTDVRVLSQSINAFIGTGGHFEEDSLARRIEADVAEVRYADLNGRARHVNFKPGWIVDEVL